MIDNTEFWKAGGQTGTRDQEFHARSQQEYPDVRIQLLEGMSEEEVVGEEVMEVMAERDCLILSRSDRLLPASAMVMVVMVT